jgi:transcriptional regulator with XRE-family HTH domain
MPHVSDSNTESDVRAKFSEWIVAVLAVQKAKYRRSKVKVADLTGVNRNTIDRWIDQKTFVSPEALRKFCDALKLDYSEPARILGWDSPAHSVDADELAEEIRRAREIAAHPKTSARRRQVLEARIEQAENARRAAASSRLTAEQMERTAQGLLRDALDDPEGADDR